MSSAEDQNPFESPTSVNEQDDPVESIVHLVRLAWLLPVVGFQLFLGVFLMAMFGLSTSLNFLMPIGVLLCLVGGVVFTIYGMYWARKYHSILWHVAGGLVANASLVIALGGVLYAAWLLIGMNVPEPV
ncbi:hypothetical protein [Bremerella sp. P1]|uniref:hypothetical protein n=1 Tax=Bremerella sp. P1 TaxID=3026424 RepID=UPI0023689C70|nr:hypothetical protein [Bremerella sp. P1]WDI42415.1 hypothetical protein PSR63_00460 [Bremerella sp. P1]